MKTYFIYWIHYPEHTDPLTEGYIGVSVNPAARLLYHSNEKYNNNQILFRAIRKKEVVQSILYEFHTAEDAYAKEISLRPQCKIGWNIIPGGDSKPPIHYGNKFAKGNIKSRHSDEHKHKMSIRFGSYKWYTNEEISIRCEEGKQPEGFRPGRKRGFKWKKVA